MAKQIYNVEVKLGRSIRIANINPKPRETNFYYAIQVRGCKKNSEPECLLFTEKEIEKCPVVDITAPMEDGILYKVASGNFDGYLLKTLEYGAKYDEWYIVVRKISKRKVEQARKRMKRNPEDATTLNGSTLLNTLKWLVLHKD